MNRKASIVLQPRRFAVSEVAAKRKSRNRVGVRVCSLGMIFVTGIALAASRYTDLRSIEPIHGDVAAGAAKSRRVPRLPWCGSPGGTDVSALGRTAARLSLPSAGLVQKQPTPKTPITLSIPCAARDELDRHRHARSGRLFCVADPDGGNLPTAPAATAGKGEALFLAGDPARGIPPCQGCHGADARGSSIATGQYAAYPALRGQNSHVFRRTADEFSQASAA